MQNHTNINHIIHEIQSSNILLSLAEVLLHVSWATKISALQKHLFRWAYLGVFKSSHVFSLHSVWNLICSHGSVDLRFYKDLRGKGRNTIGKNNKKKTFANIFHIFLFGQVATRLATRSSPHFCRPAGRTCDTKTWPLQG